MISNKKAVIILNLGTRRKHRTHNLALKELTCLMPTGSSVIEHLTGV